MLWPSSDFGAAARVICSKNPTPNDANLASPYGVIIDYRFPKTYAADRNPGKDIFLCRGVVRDNHRQGAKGLQNRFRIFFLVRRLTVAHR